MRILGILVASLLLTAVFPLAAAQMADPNASNPEWVEGDLRISMPELTTLDLQGTLTIRKYALEGTSYESADDMGNAYQQLLQADEFARANGQGSDRAGEFVRNLENATEEGLRETLSRAFPTATVSVDPALVDTNTLQPPAGDPYAPGVQILVGAQVVRTPEDIGLAGLDASAVEAVFAAGAEVATDLALSASPGHDMTYTITAPTSPAGLVWSSAMPADVATATVTTLTVRIDNSAGDAARTESVRATLVDPVARDNMPTVEEVPAVVTITLGGFTGAPTMTLEVDAQSDIHSFDVNARFPDALPENVDLPYMSADALRALRQAGAIGDDDLATINDGLAEAVKENLADILPDAQAEGGLSETDLAKPTGDTFSTEDPVAFEAHIEGGYALPEGAENADIALRMGALITFDLSLPASTERETTIMVNPPTGIVFTEAEGGAIVDDGASASFTVPMDATGASLPVKLTMKDPNAMTYTAETAAGGATFGATLDLQDIDITIGGAIGGDMGNLLGEVTVNANLGVFEVPEEFKASLPEGVDLSYITSDGVRLLIDRGVVTQEQLADLEKAFLENVTTNLNNALQVPLSVTGGLDMSTLSVADIGDVLSGDSPIVLSAKASFSKPLSGAAPEPTAASAIYSMPQTFTLPSVQGLPTTYKVILPSGLTVSDVNVDGGTSETGTENGRDYFIVTPEDGKEATASMSIGVTPGFVVAKFWPVLLLAVLVIFLLVGTPIALVVLRKRKKNAAAGEEDTE